MEEVWKTDWCGARTKEEGGQRLLHLPRQKRIAAEHGNKIKDQEIPRRQTQQNQGERRVGLQGRGLKSKGN